MVLYVSRQINKVLVVNRGEIAFSGIVKDIYVSSGDGILTGDQLLELTKV